MLPEILDSEHPSSATSLWNPPPHLEARFSRRRGRRNGTLSPSTSISSQTILSASVLATTRRQTLLEARKSLLRARAQHVERVRRSRANSHEGVSERLRTLQASMNAAQKSRDAILAKIAGSCAGEVAKAKRTAVEMRKRREEESKILKETFEERMAEAGRRRQEALSERGRKRRERSSNGGLKVDGGSDEEVIKRIKAVRLMTNAVERQQAARKILRAWKSNRDRKIVENFASLELTIESVRDAEFMAVSSKFQEEVVLRATNRLLKRCGLLDNLEGIDGAVEKSCKTFLSAYLILGHPAEVLSNDGEGEKALITKSKDLLIQFESFLLSPLFPPSNDLYSVWSEFSMAFDQWKSRDSEIIINTMLAQYAELDLIWQKVKNDVTGGVADDFKEGIRANQLLLLVRIRRLARDGTRDLIRKAVKEARRTRLPKKEKRDTKPREVPQPDETRFSVVASTHHQPVQPPQPSETLASQTGFDIASQNGLSNREIIHELLLDKDFRLKPHKRNSVEQKVEEIAKKAFWDTMRADITSGKIERWIPALADTVRSKVLRLLDPNGALYRAVYDSIDVELITQQCNVGSYDHERLLSYVVDLLPRICSPARDDDVNALRESSGEDYTSRLQCLLDVLEAMQLDHSNFLLMLSATQIIPEAVPYEKRLFVADLAAGRISLATTRDWLLTAKSELPAGTDPKAIHAHAFLNILFGPESFNTSHIPETFHLDHTRILDNRKILQTVILGGAMLVTVKTLLRRDVRGLWNDLKVRVNVLLSVNSTPEQIADGVRVFVNSTGAVPTPTLEVVQNAVRRILSRGHDDPIVRVVGNRIRAFIKERLLSNSSADKVRLASEAGETLVSWGVGEWISEVGVVLDLAQVWRAIDIQVSGEYYNQILGVQGIDIA